MMGSKERHFAPLILLSRHIVVACLPARGPATRAESNSTTA